MTLALDTAAAGAVGLPANLPASLVELRRTVSNCLVATLWVHVPILAWIAAVNGGNASVVAPAAGGLALLASLLWRMRPDASSTRLTIGVALMIMATLVTAVCHGTIWQADTHM